MGNEDDDYGAQFQNRASEIDERLSRISDCIGIIDQSSKILNKNVEIVQKLKKSNQEANEKWHNKLKIFQERLNDCQNFQQVASLKKMLADIINNADEKPQDSASCSEVKKFGVGKQRFKNVASLKEWLNDIDTKIKILKEQQKDNRKEVDQLIHRNESKNLELDSTIDSLKKLCNDIIDTSSKKALDQLKVFGERLNECKNGNDTTINTRTLFGKKENKRGRKIKENLEHVKQDANADETETNKEK